MRRHPWRFPVIAGMISVALIGSALIVVWRQRPAAATKLAKAIQSQPIQEFDGAQKSGVRYREPRGLSMSPTGNLVIADFRNYRIQEMRVSGQILNEWGSQGKEPGQFVDPACAALDAQGNLYVADTWNQRVQKRTTDGQWLPNWAQYTGFSAPRGIAIDAQNRVYVANTSGHNIVVFDARGQHLSTWGQHGSGKQDFYSPIGIAVGPDGQIYVADTGNKRIKVLSPEGQVMSVIPVNEWGFQQFHEAYLAVGKYQEIYLTLPLKNEIQVYLPQNKSFLKLDNTTHLRQPTGIAVDQSGYIYVSDTGNNRIVKYDPLPLALLTRETVNPANIRTIRILAAICVLSLLFNVFLLLRHGGFGPRSRITPPHSRRFRALTAFINAVGQHVVFQRVLYIAAAAMIIAANFYYRHGHTFGGSLCVLLGLALVMLHAFADTKTSSLVAPPQTTASDRWSQQHWLWFYLGLIAVLALILRIYRIDEIPWGINNDVAWEGIYARRILEGKAPLTVFTSETWGKETLYFYLIALSFKLFGVNIVTLNLPSIIAGTLTCVGLFLLWRKLFDEHLAGIAAVIYTVMGWNLVFARMSARCILAPLCLVYAVYWYFCAVETAERWKKLLYFLGSGCAIGLGLHTYFSFRGIPVLMILVGLYTWVTIPRFMRQNWWGLLAFMFAAMLMFAPLAIYAYHHMDVFMGRSSFLFIGHKMREAGSWQPLWDNIAANLLTLFYQAKVGNFVKNDIPIISRFVGFLAVLGGAYHLRYVARRGPFFSVLAFGFGMLPAMLSAPDAARAHLTTIALSIFAATGIHSLACFFSGERLRPVARIVAISLCLAVVVTEYHLYFNVWGNDHGAQFGYARKHTLIGYKGLELSKDYQIYISQGHFMDTPKYLCYGLPGDVFGMTNGEVIHYVPSEKLLANLQRILQLPVPEEKGLAFVFENTPENIPLFNVVKQRYPTGKRTDYTDARYGNAVIFYTYVIAKENIYPQ